MATTEEIRHKLQEKLDERMSREDWLALARKLDVEIVDPGLQEYHQE